MVVYVKNAETDRRIRELARLTGRSLTDAVDDAVRERLERLRMAPGTRQQARARFDALVAAAQRRTRTIAGDDDLYDEAGLPR